MTVGQRDRSADECRITSFVACGVFEPCLKSAFEDVAKPGSPECMLQVLRGSKAKEHWANLRLNADVDDRKNFCPSTSAALAPDSAHGSPAQPKHSMEVANRPFGIWHIHQT